MRTWRAQRGRRPKRSDALLQSAGIRGQKWLSAAHHLVQQHAHRPEICMSIDLARLQPLWRKVRDAAEVVTGHLPAQRQRFGDAEIENLDLIALENPNIARLQIAVQKGA